jgi:6-phosphogluconolactonase (cycloisomerase 2 family)
VSRCTGLIWFSLAILITGCVSPRRFGVSGGGGGGTGSIYVSNSSANSVLRFENASSASGNVVPNATISGTTTLLTSPQYLAIDTAKDRLYIANQGAGSVLVFEGASTKNGNVAPSRSISGTSTGLAAPVDVGLDTSRDLLYVADGAQVLVFATASTATGNITPSRTISVGFSIAAMLVDSSGDRLFLANGSSNAVDVYDSASTLNNTVSANRIISGAQTQLSTPSGLQIDSNGRLIVANFGSAAITMYASAATANGNIAPSATINGGNTKLSSPSQIAVESGSQLFIADGAAASILVYTNVASASGNSAPNNVITGSNTGLARSSGGTGPATAKGIAVDPTR